MYNNTYLKTFWFGSLQKPSAQVQMSVRAPGFLRRVHCRVEEGFLRFMLGWVVSPTLKMSDAFGRGESFSRDVSVRWQRRQSEKIWKAFGRWYWHDPSFSICSGNGSWVIPSFFGSHWQIAFGFSHQKNAWKEWCTLTWRSLRIGNKCNAGKYFFVFVQSSLPMLQGTPRYTTYKDKWIYKHSWYDTWTCRDSIWFQWSIECRSGI